MSTKLIIKPDADVMLALPSLIEREGPETTKRFLEFFIANTRNESTRAACARAVGHFHEWCDCPSMTLETIESLIAAANVEKLTNERGPRTVNQYLAPILILFDWVATSRTMPFNPALSVRGLRFK